MQTKLSRTKIKDRIKRKTKAEIKEIVRIALKNKDWIELARILSSSTRKYSALNLFEIDKQSKEKDIVVIPGKVLSKGDLTKSIKICALGISKTAKEKLKNSSSEFVPLIEEIKKNPNAKGVKILR